MKASLWRGRLGSSMHPLGQRFLSSFAEDVELVDIDIDVGEAHALALDRAGVFGPGELRRVLKAFEKARIKVRRLLAAGSTAGTFHDIHPVVEKMVADACGESAGGRVHLGKSRNDQVAADICIYARRKTVEVLHEVAALERVMIDAAGRMGSCLFPAYTHGRAAQATTAGHWLSAYVDALGRDADRLFAARARMNLCPLGAAAVGGTSVPVSRRFTAKLLGFAGVWPNSLDATSSRDHVLELGGALAILQSTLSRVAADLIFLCGDESGVLVYPDELADTSSAMPQKKNPDPLELVRARAATVAGFLAGSFGTVNGLVSGYSRDLQELKRSLWGTLETARDSSRIVRLVIERIKVQPGAAARTLERGYAAALDLAEVLCLRRDVPFRRAHYAVGQLVLSLSREGRSLGQAGAGESSRILSRAVGRPVTFTRREWADAVGLERGAARRRAGGPGDTVTLVRNARGRVRGLERMIASVSNAETRAQRALAGLVKRRSGRA